MRYCLNAGMPWDFGSTISGSPFTWIDPAAVGAGGNLAVEADGPPAADGGRRPGDLIVLVGKSSEHPPAAFRLFS